MPLVTLTVRKPTPPALKGAMLEAVHAALVAVGVPAEDRFQRVLELDAADFRFDARRPRERAQRRVRENRAFGGGRILHA